MTNTYSSPLPWTEFRDADSHDIIAANGEHVAHMESGHEQDANAALIVHAVNAYQELVEVLRTIGAQSLDDDWTAEQAFAFCKALARSTVRSIEAAP